MRSLGSILRASPWLFKAIPAGMLGMALLAWLLAFLAPVRYVCEWSLVLPSSDTEARVSLTDVGQASAGARSFLDGRVLDHRVNYRQILLGTTLRDRVAAHFELRPEELPRPRVRLLDQSSIFTVELRGEDPDFLVELSRVWLQFLQDRVDEMRRAETEMRRRALEGEIRRARQALDESSRRLAEYRLRSGFVSGEQLELTALRLDRVREHLIDRRTRLGALDAVVELGLAPLGLDEDRSAQALALAHDGLVMETARRWRDAEADLLTRGSVFGPNHPGRLELDRQAEVAWQRLTELATLRLGGRIDDGPIHDDELRNLFAFLSRETTRDALEQLAGRLIDRTGLDEETRRWEEEEVGLQDLLDRQIRDLATLSVLEADDGLNRALLSSSQAQSAVGGFKPFASYPLIQVLEAPERPEDRRRLHPILWVLAVLAASALWTVGMLLFAVQKMEAAS